MEKVTRITKQVFAATTTPSNHRTIATGVIAAIIIAALPLVLFTAQQQQDNRQRAASMGGFSSIAVNGCGQAIDTPAQGAENGIITWKAPVKATDGTWQTVKQDGTVISQSDMKERYVHDDRNGGTETSRALEWDTNVVSANHINCNLFLTFTNDADCTIEFNGSGSTEDPLAAGGTTTLAVTVDSGNGGGCRKLVHVFDDGGEPNPTPTGEVTPTITEVPTGAITPTDSPTPTSTTVTPTTPTTVTPSSSPTTGAGALSLVASALLNGIEGAIVPLHPQRAVTINIFGLDGTAISTGHGNLTYNNGTKKFEGQISFPSAISSAGDYFVKIQTPQYLVKQLPTTITINPTTTSVTLPVFTLIAGDANNDNKLDVLDFNMIFSCYGPRATSAQCTAKDAVDFDDNGTVTGTDYNIFLKSLATHQGD